MIRRIYRRLLRLHPEAFRDRYGAEMLEIFDAERRRGRTPFLLLDAVRSAGRQRWLRRENGGSTPALDRTPRFATGAVGGPRAVLLAPAALLSAAAFAALGYGVARGGPSGFVRLPAVLVPSSNAPLPAREEPLGLTVAAERSSRTLRSSESRRAQWPARPRGHESLITVFAGLDIDGDGAIGAAEQRRAGGQWRRLLDCAAAEGDGAILLVDFIAAVRRGESACAAARQ